MSLRFVLTLAVLVVAVAAASSAAPDAKKLTPEEKKKFCQSLSQSLLPLSCDPEYEEEPAQAFIRKTNFKVGDLPLNPVILLPGLMGSSLEATLDRDTTPEWYCIKRWDWYGIWLSLYEALAQPCWFDNLQIEYNQTLDSYSNITGVSIRPRDFGGISGVDYLDHTDDPLHLTSVYLPIIEAMLAIGYEPGVTLFGAPYDWRLPVDYLFSMTSWDEDMEALIEQAFSVNNLPVHIVTHSMGGPTFLYLLNQKPAAWREKYIASFVPMAGPWSGSVNALAAMMSGSNFNLEVLGWSPISKERVAKIAQQSGGVAYLMPDTSFWPPNQVFVTTPSRTYTVANFDQMFHDMGLPVTEAVYADTRNILPQMATPEVRTFCLYGTNTPTPISLVYDTFTPGQFQDARLVNTSDLGDGTVPLLSLGECKNWSSQQQTGAVNCREYDLRDHTGVLKDSEIIQDLLKIVTNQETDYGCDPSTTPVFTANFGDKFPKGK